LPFGFEFLAEDGEQTEVGDVAIGLIEKQN
jgi:hypothetical protein